MGAFSAHVFPIKNRGGIFGRAPKAPTQKKNTPPGVPFQCRGDIFGGLFNAKMKIKTLVEAPLTWSSSGLSSLIGGRSRAPALMALQSI